MTAAKLVNSLGLVLDIAGAVLLWKYGLPESISRSGASHILLEETDEGEIAKARVYDRWAKGGLGALIVGFLCQLISNLL